jgi:uncharacterized protein involved in exopolysaccharide biosynthesis
MASQLEFSDIWYFFLRRWKGLTISFLIVFAISVFIAYALPPKYLSQATILIEDQQIPQDFVRPAISGYVEERIKTVSQNVMVRDKLLEIIDRHELYPDASENTRTALVRRFRKSIRVETIAASVTNRRTGKSMDATVAFTISFEGRNPRKVKAVTQELANLFLVEDSKTREERSSITASFFQGELETLKQQISSYEQQISEFKQRHIGELPENARINFETIADLQREKDRVEMQIDSLTERKIILEGQLATVEPYKEVTLDGKKVLLTPSDRLRSLKIQLISMRTTLSDKHPDVKKIQREIRELEESVDVRPNPSIEKERLVELRVELADMEGRLGAKHPDVVRIKREIEMLADRVGRLSSESSQLYSSGPPDNPVYINLITQIRSTQTQIENLQSDIVQIIASISEYESRLGQTPIVEKRYNELTRDYESAKQRYKEMMNKYMNARVSQVMEDQQKGERFSLKDPPYLPEKPYKPNRGAIMILGFILASGAGFGVAASREFLDSSIKTPDELVSVAGLPMLSSVSLVQTGRDRFRKYLKRFSWFLFAGMVFLLSAYAVDSFVMPLDQLVAKVQSRVGKDVVPF